MKKIFKRTMQALFFGTLGTVAFSTASFAYLDPGTTSVIIQAVAGVVIACGVAVGAFWGKISAFFKKKKIERMEKRLEKQAEKQENIKA